MARNIDQKTPQLDNGIIVSEPEPIASTFNLDFNYIPANLSNNMRKLS